MEQIVTQQQEWTVSGMDVWGDGDVIASTRPQACLDADRTYPRSRELAQQIAREHNSHADLLAALERLTESAMNVIEEEGWPIAGTTLAIRINQARAAIRKATGDA